MTYLDHARKVAEAVLYEGYLLYPYHQASQKNQARFQFGVLMPPAYAAIDPSESSASQTQCLVECGDEARVLIGLRFLQSQRRQVRQLLGDGLRDVDSLVVAGTEYTSWAEAAEREEEISSQVAELLTGDVSVPFSFGPEESSTEIWDEAGQVAGVVSRRLDAIYGLVLISAKRVAGPFGALQLTVRVENLSQPAVPPLGRDDALGCALISAHTLIQVPGGVFISMTDPPEWAAAEVAACVNVGTWPVLAGPPQCRELMLSVPVILYDHAEIAPESQGDLFDATEIDEILTLRTLALTDAEKQAARATDPRARELMDRLEGMPPELFERLHGAIRYLESVPSQPTWIDPAPMMATAEVGGDLGVLGRPRVPWWDPGADTSVSPDTDQVIVNGVPLSRGSKVIMRPGTRRADAQDLFLAGRRATVEAVLYDVDEKVHVAVTPEDDPAADLHASHGRFLYFATDEIEPVVSPANDKQGTEDST